MRCTGFGKTDPGRKRELNEDSFAVLDHEGIYVVADGMGGHNAGEIASGIAIQTIADFFKAAARDDDMTWPYKVDPSLAFEANKLVVGIKFANKKIFRAAQANSSYAGMGTTIVSMLHIPQEEALYIAHVGDSRAYRFYDGKIEQLTDDHSLINEYIRAGQLTVEQAKNFPHKNVIMRALGMKENVLVDVQKCNLRPGELYLACSDGLSDMLSEEEMAEIISATFHSLKEMTEKLIDRANENGGKDNITVAVCKVD